MPAGAKLVLTVGLPRSGKSSWCRRVLEERPGLYVCNPDSFRLALHGQRFIHSAEQFVWGAVELAIRAAFYSGHPVVILDACNVSRKSRQRWESTEWETCFKVFRADVSVSLERAEEEGCEDLLPVIRRMAEQWEPLDEHERLHLWG